MKNLGKALLYCIGDLIVFMVVVGVCGIFVPFLPSKIATDLCAVVGFTLSIIALAMFYKGEGVNLIKECKFTKVKLNVIFKTILITICLLFFSQAYEKVAINILHIGTPSYQETQNYFSNLLTNWYGFMSVVIFVPILEEIFFRGIMLRQCLKIVNPLSGIILQGVIFGLLHMNLVGSIDSIIFGIVVGSIAYYTKSIIPGIIMHIISNLLVITTDSITESIFKSNYFSISIIGVLGLFLAIFLVYTLKENNKVKALA